MAGELEEFQEKAKEIFALRIVFMNAIILSAGLGKRMRPITNFVPKPLLSILNRPIIDINIGRLKEMGIENIYVNLFYKAEMIKRYLDKFSDFLSTATEDTLRGTGGALLNFKKIMKEDFVCHNCDVITTKSLTEAIKFHKLHKPLATLILTRKAGTNLVRIDSDFGVKEFSQNDTQGSYTYTGVSILSERIFSYLPDKENFSMIEAFQKILNAGRPIAGIPLTGLWYDIGSPKKYWQVHHDILERGTAFEEVKADSPHYVDPSSTVQSTKLSGFVSIQPHCFISDKVVLKNTVVFSNSRISEGHYKNCLLSDKFCVEID